MNIIPMKPLSGTFPSSLLTPNKDCGALLPYHLPAIYLGASRDDKITMVQGSG